RDVDRRRSEFEVAVSHDARGLAAADQIDKRLEFPHAIRIAAAMARQHDGVVIVPGLRRTSACNGVGRRDGAGAVHDALEDWGEAGPELWLVVAADPAPDPDPDPEPEPEPEPELGIE